VTHASGGGVGGGVFAGAGRRLEGKGHGEGGTLSGLTFDADVAAERLDDLLDDPQAETEAAVVALGDGALEALEDTGLVLGGDADAVISHGEEGDLSVLDDGHLDGVVGAVLDGIGEQVGDDLLEAETIPAADDGGVGVEDEGAACAGGIGLGAGDDVLEEGGEVDGLVLEGEAAGADAGDVEQVVDELVEALGGAAGGLDALASRMGLAVGAGLGERAPQQLQLELE